MIKGKWHPSKSSASFDAELALNEQEYVLHTSQEAHSTGSVNDLKISARLGNIPRKIVLPDGSMFETNDNNAIDVWQKQYQQKKNWLHKMESSRQFALAGILVTAITALIFYQYGLPAVSKGLAYAIPDFVRQSLTEQTMESLDELWFAPSELPESQQREIQQHFAQILTRLNLNPENYPVAFRQMSVKPLNLQLPWEEKCEAAAAATLPESCKQPVKLNIPNAFALPAGQIIFTDALVKLAQSQHDLDAIFLHEIAHVEQRHALQQLAQSSIITISLAMIIGDVSGLEEIALGIPVILLGSKYSREFETEADQYSFEQMVKLNIDPIHFANIMQRIDSTQSSLEQQKNLAETTNQKADSPNTEDSEQSQLEAIAAYLSSHPETKNRIEAAKLASQNMRRDAPLADR